MLTSTVMLIYDIVNNKYKVKSKTLCCGQSGIGVFAFSGTDCEASYSSRYSALSPMDESLGVEVFRDPKKSFAL